MLTVTDQRRIRQAYYPEKKSQREIARELGLSRNTVKKAIQHDEPFEYRRQQPARKMSGPIVSGSLFAEQVSWQGELTSLGTLQDRRRVTAHRALRRVAAARVSPN